MNDLIKKIILLLACFAFVLSTSAQTQQQLLTNQGFESGFSPWSNGANWYTWTNALQSHSGSKYAYYGVSSDGITGVHNNNDSVDQQFSVPTNASSLTVSFWYKISTDETGSTPYDYLHLRITNQNNNTLATVKTLSNVDSSSGWTQFSTILGNNYAGQTIKIAFQGTTNATKKTLFRIDDVSLVATLTPVNPPTNVWTGGTNSYTTTSVTILGQANPNGSATTAYFQYGATSNYGNQTSPAALGSGNAIVDFSSSLTGLTPNTTYHYRSVANNSAGTVYGLDQTFTTHALPKPNLTLTQPASWPNLLVFSDNPDSTTYSTSFNTSQAVTVTWKTKNTGAATLSSNAITKIKLNGVDKTTTTVLSGLAVNGETGNSFDLGVLTAGTYTVSIQLDHLGQIDESNESDNFFEASFTVVAQPPAITISSPTQNSSWNIGSVMPINWSISSGSSAFDHYKVTVKASDGSYFQSNVYPSTVTSMSYTVSSQLANKTGLVIVQSIGGSTSYTQEATFTTGGSVSPNTLYPIISITGYNTKLASIPLGKSVQYSASNSYGNITSWLWEFSDGTTSTLQTVPHTFKRAYEKGKGFVKLTVSGPGAASKSASVVFSVIGAGADPANDNSGTVADPVNSATGSFILGATPMSVSARGLPFAFQCYYSSLAYNPNSTDNSPKSLGYGWSHTFETALQQGKEDETRYVIISFGDGHAEKFVQLTNGNWGNQPGNFSQLTEDLDQTFSLTTKAGIKHQFDLSGRLASISDRNNDTLTVVWETIPGTIEADNQKRIAYVALPGGAADGSNRRKVLFHYQPSKPSFICKLENENNDIVEFTQDANNDLTQIKNPNLYTTSYTYDAFHQILTERNGKNHIVVTNEYDPTTRRVIRQADGNGNITVFEYDFPDDALSNRTTTIKRLATPTHPVNSDENEVSVDIHDSKLQLIERKIKVENPNLPNSFIWLSQRWAYDDVTGDTLSVWNRRNKETKFQYQNGNVTRQETPDTGVTTFAYEDTNNPNLPTLITYPDPRVKRKLEYDIKGNLTYVTFPYDAAQPLNNRRSYANDAHGQNTGITDANNKTTNTFFDQWGYAWKSRIAGHDSTSEFDNTGRVTTSIDPRLNRIDYERDGLGQITKTKAFDPNFPNDPTKKIIHTMRYNDNDDLIETESPIGQITKFHRDVLGRVWKEENDAGHTTIHRFNVFGHEYETENAKTGIVKRTFNFAGHVMTVANPAPSTNVIHYKRDENGNPTEIIDGDDVRTTMEYDVMDRVISAKRWKNATEFSETKSHYNLMGQKEWDEDEAQRKTYYFYDLAGNHTGTSKNPTTPEFSFGHDNEGNQTSATHPVNQTRQDIFTDRYQLDERTDENNKTESFTYDPAGNIETHLNADSQPTSFEHDSLNRLTRINPPTGPPVLFKYDAASRRHEMTDSTGTTKWTYTNLNQVESIEQPNGLKLSYTYDETGNTHTITYPGNRTVTYKTDAAGRFESVTDWQNRKITQTYTDGDRPYQIFYPNGVVTTLGHDSRGQLSSIKHQRANDPPLFNHTYIFNDLGQLTNPPDVPITAPASTYNRTYGNANELLTINSVSVTHDNRGNLTNAPLGSNSVSDTLTWNYANRLISGTIGGVPFTNTFNGLNQRVATNRNGVTTGFLIDDRLSMPRIMAESDASGNPTAFYLYAGNALLARILPDGTLACYHTDYQGNVILMTDSTGSSVAHYQYSPFGETVSATGTLSSSNHFRYLGGLGVWDNLDGTLDARARTYHTKLARFLSRDELYGNKQDGQSLNRYIYALNDPFGFSDPSGFAPIRPSFYHEPAWLTDAIILAEFWQEVAINSGIAVAAEIATGGLAKVYKFYKATKGVKAIVPFLDEAANSIPVIIGENMSRVNSYASKVGAETIDVWLAGRKWTPQLNDEFVSVIKAQGRQIQDIGPDFGRRLQNRVDPNLGRPFSPIYGKERQQLLDYGNYQKLYQRNGRYQGGVSNFDH